MKLDINDIVKATGAKVMQEGTVREIEGVSTDTRTLKKGDLFIAIKGPHFDGHEFVQEAVEKGACGVVVNDIPLTKGREWILQVADTVHALGDIAGLWRKKLNCTVIAVTGSNGKSTTKEMIASALSATRKVIKTEGNFNNLIGLPLQVLCIEADHEVAVLEMGMNAPGEIARLAEIANPDIGLITNVNPAHLEKLHTIENVAKAKGELFKAMRHDGTVIINSEDIWVKRLGDEYLGKKVTFGMQNDCDVRFGRLIMEELSEAQVAFYAKGREYAMHLPVPGTHNVMNALSAIAVGTALGVSVTTMIPCLESFKPIKMRMERIQLLNGVQLINDCYNANPSSMLAALRTVGAAKKAGRFIAVLGEMLELGDAAATRHKELGMNAVANKVSKLFAIGEHAEKIAEGAKEKGLNAVNVVVANSVEELCGYLLKEVSTGDCVLVKGSRGMKMERVVEFLKDKIGA